MKPDLLVLNAGSSSLKFAVYPSRGNMRRAFGGTIERIGRDGSRLTLKGGDGRKTSRAVDAPDHAAALDGVLAAVREGGIGRLKAVAHRIVHGGPRYFEPQAITVEVVAELRRLSPFDPEHLPPEIALIEAMGARDPALRQIACFDTAFHRELPRVARVLPLPRRYEAAGVRRYGFHGLSYQFLLEELARIGDPAAQRGRVILAHLGNGASLAAVRDGRCIDTSMSFTPAAGLVMGTRTGDLDPGLSAYLAAVENMSVARFQRLVNHESGLRGISETSADMRELLDAESTDARAAEAVDVFCYQAKKWIGGYAAALGGLDTLVFSGGIGENCPSVRARICAGLEFLGLAWDERRNASGAGVISAEGSRVTVRVLPTDEEQTMARAAAALLGASANSKENQP